MNIRQSILVLFLLAAGLPNRAIAHPGDVDVTFGDGGVTRVDIGYFDNASDLAIQKDLKIVGAGTVSDASRRVFVLRLLENGRLDPRFGSGGLVVPDRFHQLDPRIAIQPDGRIVVATRGESDGGSVFLYRFDANGHPDPEFGNGGIATLLPAGYFVAGIAGIGILPDSRIVVVVRADTYDGTASIGFARFDPHGSPDGTFGVGGFRLVPGFRFPLGFAMLADGRMLVSGSALTGGPYLHAFVARFLADGTLDASFEGGGVTIVASSSFGTDFQSLAVAQDGSLYAGGVGWGEVNPYESRWYLARLHGNGSRDFSFGTAGVVAYEPGPGSDGIADVLPTQSGVYAAGRIESSELGLNVASYRLDGQLDPSFGVGGFAVTPDRSAFGASRIALQGKGRIVAFGSIQSWVPTFNQDLYLTRYEGTCPMHSVELGLSPRTINPRSNGRWISAVLEPDPPTTPAEIRIESVRLLGSIPIDPGSESVLGDEDGDGRPDLRVKFDRALVERSLDSGESVPVTIEGEIADGCFDAIDHIRVLKGSTVELHAAGGATGFALGASSPNPSNCLRLNFILSDARPLTAIAYDLKGRVVARREVGDLGPGTHEIELSAPNALPAGVYWIHLVRGEQRLTARAVVVR